jgi:hypothetical protein
MRVKTLEVLKPLVPKSWANPTARYKRDLAALQEDISEADPKRPQFLIDELDLVISLAVAIHKDVRQHRQYGNSRG